MKKLKLFIFAIIFFGIGIYTNIYFKTSNSEVIDDPSLDAILALPFHLSDGSSLSLSQIDIQDKLVINFWATWCEPCKKELPQLNKFHQQFINDDKIQIIGIAIDEPSAVKIFNKEIPVDFVNLIDEQNGFSVTRYLKNEKGVLPYTVIVNKQYEVIEQFYGEITLEMLLKAFK